MVCSKKPYFELLHAVHAIETEVACAEAAGSRLAITGSSLCFEAFGEATSLQDPRLLKPLPENTILLETPDPRFNVHLQSIFLPGVPSLVVNIDLGGVGV